MDIEIVPDWGGDAAMGMQASGSNSVRIQGRFVPDAHIVASPLTMLSTEDLPDGTPGTRLHGEGLFLGILFGWFSCEFGAILTGAARAALEEYEQLLRNKPLLFDPRRTRMHDPEFQRILGEALCRADAAQALTLSGARMHMEQCRQWLQEGRPITWTDTLRVWKVWAARLVAPPASAWKCFFIAPVRLAPSAATGCSATFATCRCTAFTYSRRRWCRCCGPRSCWVRKYRLRFAAPERQ